MDVSTQTTGKAEVLKTLAGLEHLVDEQLLQRIGFLAELLIKQRTAKGQDVQGNFFRGYSDKYKIFRQDKGRGTSPNLFFSGKMLGAMTHKTENGDTVRIFFADTQQAAKASGNQRRREFFGLSADDLETLSAEIDSELEERIDQ